MQPTRPSSNVHPQESCSSGAVEFSCFSLYHWEDGLDVVQDQSLGLESDGTWQTPAVQVPSSPLLQQVLQYPGTWWDLIVIPTRTKTYTYPILGNPESVFRSCDHFPGYHMWYVSFSTEIVRGAMPYNLLSLSIPTRSLTSKLLLQCTCCGPSPPPKNFAIWLSYKKRASGIREG